MKITQKKPMDYVTQEANYYSYQSKNATAFFSTIISLAIISIIAIYL